MNAPVSLYKLADGYLEASQRLADLDLPPEVVQDTLEGMAGELEVKAANVAMFARNLEATAESIRAAESDMAKRRESIAKRAQQVRDYLKAQMERTGITQIECPYFKVSIKNNPPAVVIDAASQIPQEFMRTPEPPPPAPDKKAIGAALKAGKEVAGCHLASGTRLEIK